MKLLILIALVVTSHAVTHYSYNNGTTAIHNNPQQVPRLVLIQGVGPNNLHPAVVANPGMDGYYIGGMPNQMPQMNNQMNNQPNQMNNQMMQMLQMQMMQNMQMSTQMNMQYMQKTAGSNRKSRKKRNPLQSLTTKGKVNTGLIGIGIANELVNKDSKYVDKKKVRMGVGGAFLLNNILR